MAEESLAIYYDNGSVILVEAESNKEATITLEQIVKFGAKFPDRSIYLTSAIKSRTEPWYRKLRPINLIEMLKLRKSNMIRHIRECDL